MFKLNEKTRRISKAIQEMENKLSWSTLLHRGMQMYLTGHQKCYRCYHVLQMQISVGYLKSSFQVNVQAAKTNSP